MSKHGELAYEYFMRGFNCSQSVAAAFSQELGLPEETILRMTAGFGAGMGRLREVCGAFSGAVFVLSCLYGSADPSQKSQLYARVQELALQYRNENGGDSIVCRELLELDRAEGSPQASDRTAEYYRKRPCPQLVQLSADLLSDYLAANPLPGDTL
ncbi:MAG: C-GCAxxG-C-C family protein [Candidatus Onthomonas sp.]